MKNNFSNLNIYAENDRQNFGYNGIRYKTEKYKIAEYGVCSYKLLNAPDAFVGGKVFLRFNRIEPGLKILVNNGVDPEFIISNLDQ